MAKLKSYDFWVQIASAILIVLRVFGSEFGLNIDGDIFMDIATGIAGVLVMLGIISAPTNLAVKRQKGSSKIKTGDTNMDKEVEMGINEVENVETSIKNAEEVERISNESKEVENSIKNAENVENSIIESKNGEESIKIAENQDFPNEDEDIINYDKITTIFPKEEEIEIKETYENKAGEEVCACDIALEVHDKSTEIPLNNKDDSLPNSEANFNALIERIDNLLKKLEEI